MVLPGFSMVRRSSLPGGGALVAYAAALLILCVGTWQILLAREAAVHDAEASTRNLSRSLAQQAARSIEAVDLVLSGIVERIEAGALEDPARLRRLLDWRRTMVPQIRDIMVLDAGGDWIADSIQTAHEPINTADRPYFAWHRAHADEALHIEAPVASRYGGAVIIPVSRRWNKPDGTFGGVVMAALRPDHFQEFYNELGVGTEGSINLLSLSGRVLARHPTVADVLGRDLSDAPLFRERLPASPAGTFMSHSPIDGIQRIAAYERVDGYPLVVFVGRSVAEVLAPWRHDALVQAAILALAAAVLASLGLGLGRHQRRAFAAEAAVSASEARYRQLAETTTDVITRLDLAFKRTYVSPTCRNLFGYEPEEMLGAQPFATIDPGDAPAVRELARRLTGGEIPGDRATTSYRTRHKLGHTIWIESGLSLVRDVSGAPEAVVCTLRDVTERKRAERALAVSEAQYRLLSENATDMVTQMDLTGQRVFVSPACLDLLGYEAHELVGTRPQDAVHPDDTVGLAAFLGRLVDGTCDRGTHVNRLRHRDGRWIWIEASLKRLADGEGRCTGFVAALRNITDRRLADEALRQSEARYRMLADNTSDVIMLRDRDPHGGRSYVSPAVRTMLGYEPDEFGALSIPELVHPEDLAATMERYGSLGPEVPSVASVHRLRHKNGSYVWVEIIFRLVGDDLDGRSRVLGAIRDVSERQRQALRLEAAMAAAEAGARIKAEFLANMSHELRTPLTGMLGVHDLLQGDPTLSERQRHFVELAQDSGQALLTIVNDILDFSKIEAGQMTIERVPFRLRDLVQGCRQLGTQAIKLQGVRLSEQIEEDVPDLFLGDPTRVRQVLLNLTTNAIKFTVEGDVKVHVSHASGRLRFAVSDTGIGIPPGVVPHLFERFSQADGSTARRFGGTGLGLAICKRLVELMGGRIGMESALGRGSTFWFELPLVAAEQDRRTGLRRNALAQSSERPRRILVAEDTSINQQIVLAVLTQKGHTVTMVDDGAEALGAFRDGVFDVILMDVQMPGMDGLAATREIRRLERIEDRSATPIVALTANAMAEEAALCRGAGMNAHVAKPIDWKQLFDTIDQVCDPSIRDVADTDGDRGHVVTPAVFDEGALDSLALVLGGDRIPDLLTGFRREAESRITLMESPTAPPVDIASHAHALVSLAGQLGFAELSALCADAERRAPEGCGSPEIGSLRAAFDRAISACSGSELAQVA